MPELADPQIWLSLLTLTVLEIVLGVDNIVFIAVLTQKLPAEKQKRARQLGIALALITRLMLLFAISWVIGLTAPLFELFGHGISWRDIILIAGGGFLIYKATHEIHEGLEGDEDEATTRVPAGFAAVVAQIAVLDIVFSLD
ncbi:MAG: TerC family protein, partial [Dongiaceae bacterium]